MTITIDATYEDGVLKPAEPLPFQEHAQVRVTVEPQTELPAGAVKPAGQPERTLIDEILEIANSIPEEVVNSWPRDGASQHDHYIYGTPKRTDLRDEPE
jgi:predicted DNA-binding antitoxin AbrB/MazE fold protein